MGYFLWINGAAMVSLIYLNDYSCSIIFVIQLDDEIRFSVVVYKTGIILVSLDKLIISKNIG